MLRKAFFVADEDRLTANLVKFAPAQEAEAELQRLCRAAAQHEAWLHHQRLARLARVLVREFAALKRDEGWVDMNDVEQAAHRCCPIPVLSGWIQERLDARVRHLLVDEFQDTNPLQWQALHGWLSGYVGRGRHAPSVFIVGDPKQSIYRFRRAEPQVFAAAQRFVARRPGRRPPQLRPHAPQCARGAGGRQPGDGRSAGRRPVPGLPAAQHRARRARPPAAAAGRAAPRGRAHRSAPRPDGWRDSLTEPRELPEEHLVTLECRQAAQWIAGASPTGRRPPTSWCWRASATASRCWKTNCACCACRPSSPRRPTWPRPPRCRTWWRCSTSWSRPRTTCRWPAR
jgi:ATP-dependent helicase/nuclease subunit A